MGDIAPVGREAELAEQEKQKKIELEHRIARLEPLEDRCLVRVVSMQTMSESGRLHIPDSAQEEKSTDGIVIRTGPGKYNPVLGELAPMFVKAGDRVSFSKWTGSEVPNVDEVMLFRQGDFGCIMHDDPIDNPDTFD